MADQTSDNLAWLSRWYAAQCNAVWEHDYGVEIQSLDNPGWLLKIDLTDTDLAERPFETLAVNMDASDGDPTASWYLCKVQDGRFEAAGGAHDLMTLLGVFRAWVERKEP